MPNWDIWIAVLILAPLMIVKASAFLFILAKFNLKPRTAYLTALTLGNYSEFGLIVGVVGMNIGLIAEDWVVAMALLMSLSFIVSAPLNKQAHDIFDKYKTKIMKINRVRDSQDSAPIDFENAKIIVVGLGSIGRSTFENLEKKFGRCVIGLDYNHERIHEMQLLNYHVKWADTTDSELWDNVDCQQIKAVFLTMTDFASNANTLKEMNRSKHKGFKVFAISHFPDETLKYQKMGAEYVFEYKEYLGKDFVENALDFKSIKVD